MLHAFPEAIRAGKLKPTDLKEEDRDYYLDGQGEYVKVNGQTFGSSLSAGAAYAGLYWTNPIGYGSGYDRLYESCFGGVNRANYVIDGVERMLEKTTEESAYKQLEELNAEAKG